MIYNSEHPGVVRQYFHRRRDTTEQSKDLFFWSVFTQFPVASAVKLSEVKKRALRYNSDILW